MIERYARAALAVLPLLAAAAVDAAPLIVAAPYPADKTPKPTYCGWYMDAAAKQTVPVAKTADGQPYCKLDISNVSVGEHTVTATHIVTDDPVFANTESAKSAPLVFTRPGPAGVPTGLKISKE